MAPHVSTHPLLKIAVYKQETPLNEAIARAKDQGETIGFVPTMGALHPGHISLIKSAKEQCDFVVVSIFINPTQFNNSQDLENYPRTEDSDISLLNEVGCDAIFTPDNSEIYQNLEVLTHDYGRLTSSLEGAFRPGHFDGVITVVRRLFEIVVPNMAFFGEKDFQQLAVIKHLVKSENLGVKVVGCATIRDKDGLALSSRNKLLAPTHRVLARRISQILHQCKDKANKIPMHEIKTWAENEFLEIPELALEYFEIISTSSFERLSSWNSNAQAVVACEIGGIRLIDNILLFSPVGSRAEKATDSTNGS